MDAITQHRKKRLEQLIAAPPYNGDRAAFMKKAKLTKGRVSQLLDPSEKFGELSASRLCQTLGLAEGWFEQGAPGKPVAWPFLLVTPEQISQLSPEKLALVQKWTLDLLEIGREPRLSDISYGNIESPSGQAQEAARKPIRVERVEYVRHDAEEKRGTSGESEGVRRTKGKRT